MFFVLTPSSSSTAASKFIVLHGVVDWSVFSPFPLLSSPHDRSASSSSQSPLWVTYLLSNCAAVIGILHLFLPILLLPALHMWYYLSLPISDICMTPQCRGIQRTRTAKGKRSLNNKNNSNSEFVKYAQRGLLLPHGASNRTIICPPFARWRIHYSTLM